ncbi:MAG: DUF2339 domain-containing protein [Planctomycetota bacterium]|jgi:uncharacterized membrane protein|nr:DUF2339 domain-containing protein [Planctomycetota bacterium]MDP6764314.1 DUF2339 domain-containing protein [Planctomycetota bacterium]
MTSPAELLLTLIALAVLGAILGGVVLGGIALGRIKALARRVEELEATSGVGPAGGAPGAGHPPVTEPADGAEEARWLEDASWPQASTEAGRARKGAATPGDDPRGEPAGGLEDESGPEPAAGVAPQADDEADAGTTASTPPSPLPRKRFRPRGVEWERLLGIRGAAILGGVALVIAALFFFQYAIQEGWFDERMRVWTGAGVGTFCLLVHPRLRGAGYRVVADVLAGSGAAVHYAAAWAGFRLYDLFPHSVGFAWMVLTTVACGALALRARSQLIAVFGLVGGFATPLLLSAVPSGAVTLFSYILLLDLALLGIGRHRDWPWMGLLGLAGTVGIQVMWLLDGNTEEAAAGLVACGVFGLLFAAFGGDDASPHRRRWRAARVGGVLLPFGLALHYANLVELGDDYWLIAAVAALLAGAGAFLGRRLELLALPTAAAAGAAALSATWLLAADAPWAALTELALWTGATAVLIAALGAWPRRERGGTDSVAAATYSLLILFAVTWTVLSDGREAWHPVWPVVWIHLLLAIRSRTSLPALPVLAGLAAGLALAAAGDRAQLELAQAPAAIVFWAPFVAPATAAALLALAVGWRAHPAPRALALAALGCAFWLLFLQYRPQPGAGPAEHYAPLLVATLVAACAAARCASAAAAAVVVAVAAAAHVGNLSVPRFEAQGWLLSETAPWLFASVAVTTLAPVCFRSRLGPTRALGLVAAASVLVGLGHTPLERWIALWEHARGEAGVGIVCLIGALPPLAGFLLARDEPPASTTPHGLRRARTAYAAAACLLVALAVPLELDASMERGFVDLWPWIALAPAAAGWAWLATRRTSPLCTLAALAAAIGAAVPWVVLTLFPDAFVRQDAWLVNGFSYAYGLAFVASLVVLHFTKAPIALDATAVQGEAVGAFTRALDEIEARLCAEGGAWSVRTILRAVLGALSCLLPFAWLSLLVVNAHGESQRLRPDAIDLNGNLVLSLVWALYSFALLALGARRGVVALRWASLAFLLATIGKVFLHDLANLDGLQRVGSFFGLALCLILVSLFYQRFVFTRRPAG